MEEESICWICLEGASAERGQLARPCNCPRDVHLRCLSRWCLQQAGRSEERLCRFCKSALPDWKAVLTGPAPPACDPIMVVTLGQVVHKIRVKPGEEGRRQFQQEIRRLFNIPAGVDFEVTFRCKAPCTSETIQLEGMSSYHAATHCASLMAAQRLAAAGPSGSTLPAGSQAPIAVSESTSSQQGAGSSSEVPQPALDTQPIDTPTPQEAQRVSNSGSAGAPQQGITLRQRLGTGLRRALSALQGNNSAAPSASRTRAVPPTPAAQPTVPAPTPVAFPQVITPAGDLSRPEAIREPWQSRHVHSPWRCQPIPEMSSMQCDDSELSSEASHDRRQRVPRTRRSKRVGANNALPLNDAPAFHTPWGLPVPATWNTERAALGGTSRLAVDDDLASLCPALPTTVDADSGSAQRLLASSTGSGMMLLDEEHHAVPGLAHDSLEQAQGFTDAAAKEAAGGYVMGSTQPIVPVRRSPRNHQLGTWANCN